VFDGLPARMADVTTRERLCGTENERRFDEAINDWHCRLNGCLLLNPHQRPVFSAQIYVEMPRRAVNISVYNLKIELACTALKMFFEPCAEVPVSVFFPDFLHMNLYSSNMTATPTLVGVLGSHVFCSCSFFLFFITRSCSWRIPAKYIRRWVLGTS